MLVWYAQRVGMGATLEAALLNAATHAPITPPADNGSGTGSGTSPPSSTPSGGATTLPSTAGTRPTSPTPTGSLTTQQALSQMQDAAKALDEAKASGDLAQIGAASQRMEDAVKQYLALVPPGTPVPGSSTGTGSASTGAASASTGPPGSPTTSSR